MLKPIVHHTVAMTMDTQAQGIEESQRGGVTPNWAR